MNFWLGTGASITCSCHINQNGSAYIGNWNLPKFSWISHKTWIKKIMQNSMFQIMKFWDAFNTSVIPSRDRTDLPPWSSRTNLLWPETDRTLKTDLKKTTNSGSCWHESATSATFDYQFHNRLVASVAVKWPLIDWWR